LGAHNFLYFIVAKRKTGAGRDFSSGPAQFQAASSIHSKASGIFCRGFCGLARMRIFLNEELLGVIRCAVVAG
jgi:hypothetical protein